MTALLSDTQWFAIRQKYAGGGLNTHVCINCLTPIHQRERYNYCICMTCAKKDPALVGLASHA
jgi:hypothetical protein